MRGEGERGGREREAREGERWKRERCGRERGRWWERSSQFWHRSIACTLITNAMIDSLCLFIGKFKERRQRV